MSERDVLGARMPKGPGCQRELLEGARVSERALGRARVLESCAGGGQGGEGRLIFKPSIMRNFNKSKFATKIVDVPPNMFFLQLN